MQRHQKHFIESYFLFLSTFKTFEWLILNILKPIKALFFKQMNAMPFKTL